MSSRRPYRFSVRGHPSLRATHHKTLEITCDKEVTTRGTCIIGVEATLDPQIVARLRGPVVLRLRRGSWIEEVHGIVSPFTAVRSSLVFRRSGQQFGNTFAYGASRAARDLDRDFIAGLQSRDVELEVEIEELAEPVGHGALTLLAVAADASAERPPAAVMGRLRAVDAVVSTTPERIAPWAEEMVLPVFALDRESVGEGLERLKAGGRMALLVDPLDPTRDLLAWDWIGAAVRAGIPVSPLGLMSPLWATLMSAGWVERRWWVDLETVRRPQFLTRRLQAIRAAKVPVLFADVQLPVTEVVSAIHGELGDRRLCIASGWGSDREVYIRGCARELLSQDLAALGRWTDLQVVVDLDERTEAGLPTALVERLLDAGVSVRTLSGALEGELGWPHRKVYRALLDLDEERSQEPACESE